MKKRPFLFVVLGIIHLLEPLSKILYFKYDTGFSFATIMSNIANIEGFKNLFEFWILFPLGGIALLLVKRWSYALFVGVQVYSLYSHILYQEFTWPYVSKTPFYSSMILIVFNLGMVFYFALPSVRRPFFDRRMRWWETKPRYGTEIPCKVHITAHDVEHDSTILNISETGAFVEYSEGIKVWDKVKVTFHYYDEEFSVTGSIVNRHIVNGIDGFGIQFHFDSMKKRFLMRRFIRKLKNSFKNSYETKQAA